MPVSNTEVSACVFAPLQHIWKKPKHSNFQIQISERHQTRSTLQYFHFEMQTLVLILSSFRAPATDAYVQKLYVTCIDTVDNI